MITFPTVQFCHEDLHEWLEASLDTETHNINLDNGPMFTRIEGLSTAFRILTKKNDITEMVYFQIFTSENETNQKVCNGRLEGNPSFRSILIYISAKFESIYPRVVLPDAQKVEEEEEEEEEEEQMYIGSSDILSHEMHVVPCIEDVKTTRFYMHKMVEGGLSICDESADWETIDIDEGQEEEVKEEEGDREVEWGWAVLRRIEQELKSNKEDGVECI